MNNDDGQSQLLWLFANPVIGHLHPQARIINQRLKRDAQYLQAAEPGTIKSNIHGWHSSGNLFTRPEESFQELRKWILDCCNKASTSIKKDFRCEAENTRIDGWVNINHRTAYNAPHSHSNSHWSGVYYVCVPDKKAGSKAGHLEFLDPRGGAITSSSLPGATCFSSSFVISPKDGLLLIFPSYLTHWVHPSESSSERISIAFNLKYAQ